MKPLITQLPEDGTGKSRSRTSNILLRSVDTRNYATENCVINAYKCREFWGQNFYRHSANLVLFVTFYVFLKRHFKKNVKSHVFWNLKKKHKIRILEHCCQGSRKQCESGGSSREPLIKVLKNRILYPRRFITSESFSYSIMLNYSDFSILKEILPDSAVEIYDRLYLFFVVLNRTQSISQIQE